MMRRRNMGDGCLIISPLSSVRPSFQSSCGFPATLFETSFRPCSQSKRGNWMIHSTPIFMASVFPSSCWWKPLSTSRYWRGLPSRSKRFSNDPSILDPYSTTKHRSCATEAGTAVERLFQKRERRQFWGDIHIQSGITHVALAQNNTMFFIDPTSEFIYTIFIDASLQAGEAFDYM